MKRTKNNLTEIEENETNAISTIDANLSHGSIPVRNGMWAFCCDCYCEEGQDEIVIMRNQVNHNSVSPSIANRITNNILGNPINANLTGKTYQRDMGGDIHCLLTWNKKVNACSKKFYIL